MCSFLEKVSSGKQIFLITFHDYKIKDKLTFQIAYRHINSCLTTYSNFRNNVLYMCSDIRLGMSQHKSDNNHQSKSSDIYQYKSHYRLSSMFFPCQSQEYQPT